MRFYQSPSGRLHVRATCSGGPGERRMKVVQLTGEQLQAIWDGHLQEGTDPTFSICRCARHKVPNRTQVGK